MKLIIQIPCYNEADALPRTLADLPRAIDGVDHVEWLIVDDGSEDGTSEVARRCGVDHVVRHPANRGLARAFTTGLDECLARGADIIVNTDADNQYRAVDIPALVAPLLSGGADMVVGARPVDQIDHFSPAKRVLQRVGSSVVRLLSKTDVPDAPSGFRAMTREAAQRLSVIGEYTYTLETLVQAGHQNMRVASVPVRVNPDVRPSRLVRSSTDYVLRSAGTLLRVFVAYRPFRIFGAIALVLLAGGVAIGARFLYLYFTGGGQGNVQSLILAAALLVVGFQTLLAAFMADLIAHNRKLLEEIRLRIRRQEGRDDRKAVESDGRPR